MLPMQNQLIIKGAREHNLKNIDLTLEKNKLIVISGLSGSGKSSLAFDTIFAEGQRRYVESLSAYARMFLGRMEKPDVDYMEGLQPAIAIEQKSTHKNPRSTVGTITEIYDYYRLLWARCGVPHCPNCGREISEMSVDQIIDVVFSHGEGTRIMVSAPIAIRRKGEYKKVFDDAKKAGYQRVKVDGTMYLVDDVPKLEKQVKHTIDVVVDRLVIRKEDRQRLADSIETCDEMTGGLVKVTFIGSDRNETEQIFSEKNSCPFCGITLPEIEPRLFSFNNPYGACPECNGLGVKTEFDPDLLIPDYSLSFNQGAVVTNNPDAAWSRVPFEALAAAYHFSLDTPFDKLPKEIVQKILYGTEEPITMHYVYKNGEETVNKPYPGLLKEMWRRYRETQSMQIKVWMGQFMKESVCPVCHGDRLRPEALAVTLNGKNIIEATHLSVRDSLKFFNELVLTENQQKIAGQILKEIRARLTFLNNVGLQYLTIDRASATLSGGEAQRIRLATQIGSQLVNVLYILDEPSIGLHQRDNERLISSLKELRDMGNTVIVVEHDRDMMLNADYIVDIGPGAGRKGGNVVFQGTPKQMLKQHTMTSDYLNGTKAIELPEKRRKGNGKSIWIHGASGNNLKNVDVEFPLGKLIVVTGVSGSGKSTLINETLQPILSQHFFRSLKEPMPYASIEGMENLDKVVNVDQSPIGRTPRSNPATYTGVFSDIRSLFVNLPEAKIRGYKPGRFSFNVKGGRCEACGGNGYKTIEMNFLPDVMVPCEVCHGKRYNRETLEVRYKGKSIADVLDMTVNQAVEFFENVPDILRKIKTIQDVGLGYIKLGQPSTTLSGGECQRMKLATELSKRDTGKTMYILDEPTTGLHFEDIRILMNVLEKLVDKGNTVLIIEHNLDVIKLADYIIDMGPEGGRAGGQVMVTGTPEEVAASGKGFTARFIKEELER